MSFIEHLRETRPRECAAPVDPWNLPLARLRGKVSTDQVERIATQTIFDHLEVPSRMRNAQACRRLAKLMLQLGWKPIRRRGLGRDGFRDQVRGWAKDHSSECAY